MLKTSEVLSLEKRWKQHKIRNYTKNSTLILLLVSAIPLAWLSHNYLFDTKVETISLKQIEEANTSQTQVEKNITTKSDLEQYKEFNKNIQEEILSIKEEILKFQQSQTVEEVPLAKKTKSPKIVQEQELVQGENIDEDFLTENLIEIEPYDENEILIPQKPRINIETSELKGLSTLKEKFYETKNIIFALMLAEEYYHVKNYKNSLKWALISNELDSKNERSWIIFAKSKGKSGHPKKAIQALEAYLKINPNAQEIKAIIQKIKHGEY